MYWYYSEVGSKSGPKVRETFMEASTLIIPAYASHTFFPSPASNS